MEKNQKKKICLLKKFPRSYLVVSLHCHCQMTVFGEILSTIYTEYFYRKNLHDSSGLWSSIHHCIVQRNIRSFCILQDINTRHCLYLIIMVGVSFAKWGREVRRQTRTPGVSTGWWVRHTVIYAYIYKCIHIRVYIYITEKCVYMLIYT